MNKAHGMKMLCRSLGSEGTEVIHLDEKERILEYLKDYLKQCEEEKTYHESEELKRQGSISSLVDIIGHIEKM